MISRNILFLSVTQTHNGTYTRAHTPRTVSTVAPGPDGAPSPPMTMLHKWIEPRSRGLHACFAEPQWCMGCFLWKKREGGGECIWCLSLERQTRTALNSSNPTPILAHAFGHFPATGSLTEHIEVSGIRSPSPLGSGGCVGGELYLDVCLSADVHSCVCTAGRRCKCDVNVEAI